MDDQAELPAALGLEHQRTGRECQLNVHSVQQRTAHAVAQFVDIGLGVNQHLGARHLQRPMDVRIAMQQFDDLA